MNMMSFHRTIQSAGSDERSSLPIPTVYEQFPLQTTNWAYHVLKINTEIEALPEAEQLNGLGKEGWILVSVLDERTSKHGSFVHYYFVRQDVQA
ncbi:hypothetical protein [Dictyobacter arantiisoli]|uniref:DUF4177 domain-containing protein n=1 Tax=Dictyobacter arantiisoli TaxID=2014874 RepID=A0A5A5TER7_9CHLR|nr:hypothetical protein [Dictyobacter arantiisoli]GCF09404.1 hypothetical protein KDI_29680 [Dictyobacter arantiisoli]